jgi:hypothetical protein
MINKFRIILILQIISVWGLFAEPPNWEKITGTQYSMTLIAEITLNGEAFTGNGNGNIVAAFGPGGEVDCRALGFWESPTVTYWYFTIVATNSNGEQIDLKIYDAASDTVFETQYSIEFLNNSIIGSFAEPEIIEFSNPMQPPQNVTISINTITPTIILVELNWSAVTGAQAYYIYSGDTPNVDTNGTYPTRVTDESWTGLISEDKKFYVIVASDEEADNFKHK